MFHIMGSCVIVSGVCGSLMMPVSLKVAKRLIGEMIASADTVNHLFLVVRTKTNT